MIIKFLNKHGPIQKKYKRGNQMSFVTKDSPKAFMKISKLRNSYLQKKTGANRILYKKQRNYCVSSLSKSETRYYANLDEKKVSNQKILESNKISTFK